MKKNKQGFSVLRTVLFAALLLFGLSAKSIAQLTVTRYSTSLIGGIASQDSVRIYSQAPLAVTSRFAPTLAGSTITGITGVATSPVTGQTYCLLNVNGTLTSVLASINVSTGVCTSIGNLGDNFASLTFSGNGSLFGTTTDAAATPATMYRLNTTDATKTFFQTLTPIRPGGGEVVAYCRDNNSFYRWSGDFIVYLQRFDTTGAAVPTDISNTPFQPMVTGALYTGGGNFTTSNAFGSFYGFQSYDTSGNIAALAGTMPTDDFRGFGGLTATSSISSASSTAICSGSSVLLSVTGGTGNYQWYMNGNPIPGATNATYTVTAAGDYNAIYTDNAGTTDSTASGIVITVSSTPTLTLGANPAVCFGATTATIPYSNSSLFGYTGGTQTYTVPGGVTSVTFDVVGASGSGASGGLGGRVQGTLAVLPGEVLNLFVGGSGATSSFNGGGGAAGVGAGRGGGASDIRVNGTTPADRVVVAGGGGGSGYYTMGGATLAGGAGGNTTGGNGQAAAGDVPAMGGNPSTGGFGGFSAPYFGNNGGDATSGNGSTGSTSVSGSGGGGGGYTGGGGGARGGGGGGSSYVSGAVTTPVYTQGFNNGDGQIAINYDVTATYTYSIVWDPAATAAGFTDVTNAPVPAGGFTIPVPAGATPLASDPVTYSGTLTVNNGTCTSTGYPVSVTVKPVPALNTTLTPHSICDNTVFNYEPASNDTNATFTYTRSAATGIAGGPTAGTGNPNETLDNTTDTANTVTYMFTSTDNGCSTTQNVVVTVNATPVLSSTTATSVCSGTPFMYTQTSNTFGTTFSWSRAAVAHITPGTASGTGNINETLVNDTAIQVVVIYVDTLTVDGCTNTQNITVTVNPTPTIYPTPLVGSICNGDNFTFTATSQTPASDITYSYTRTGTTDNPATSGTTATINETLVNTSNSPATITYVYTLTAYGCSNIQTVQVVVNPTPTLSSSLTPPSICDSSLFHYVATSATSGISSITWTRSLITGIANPPATGNDTVNEYLDNTTDNAFPVTYVFTLGANGCFNTQNVNVVVNPTPRLSSTLTPAAICDSTVFNYMDSTHTAGATATWTRAAVAGISNPASGGTGNISETLNNTTPNPIAVTYVYTLTVDGCTHTDNVVVTVNPKPVFNNVAPAAICDSTVFSYDPSSATPGPVTYSWSRAFVPGINSLPNSGTGNPNEVLNNTTNVNVPVVYSYTLTANGCSNVENITVIVHPTPTLHSAHTGTVCSGAPYAYTPTSLTPDVTYTYTRDSVMGITPVRGSGSGPIMETLINNTPNNQVIVYNITLRIGTCTYVEQLRVTVQPSAASSAITIHPLSDLCQGSVNVNFGADAMPVENATYSWTATNATVALVGNTGQYALVNFPNTGTASVTLTAGFATGCSSSSTYTVNVNGNTSVLPDVIFTNGHFVCLQNDVTGFQWGYDDAHTLDSSIIAGQIDQSYFIDGAPDVANKNYWVITTTGNGCFKKSYYNMPTGVTDLNMVSAMKVYPNPAVSELSVEVSTAAAGSMQLEVMNMLGQKVNTVRTNDHKTVINVAGLSAGYYIVDCYVEGIKIGTAKFIKN